MTSPEFLFYDRHEDNFLHLREPEDWLLIPGRRSRPVLHGSNQRLPGDPFEAIDRYVSDRNGGYLGGWVSYDFARLNPRFPNFDEPAGAFPPVLLAHYRDVERTSLDDSDSGSSPRLGSFESTLDRNRYRRDIRNALSLIRRGYLYQLNYSQRFRASVRGDLRSLLCEIPADLLPPQTAYGAAADWEFLSLSPERFLEVDGRSIRTQPIKGTRPRAADTADDRAAAKKLLGSEKDAAEHVMIVDLERNDLNRVCEPGSVHVPERRKLRSFPTVHHLVSTVEGKLRTSVTPSDLLRELFPGGSITGCPKPISMRVIDALEDRRRGLYTGSVGYWNRDENYADWNIAIRTLVRRGDRVTWDAGGGIVADSQPEDEYRESLDKVALVEAVRGRNTSRLHGRSGRTAP